MFPFPGTIVLLSTLIVPFVLLFIVKASSQKLPPGPRKLPFIGNLHQLTGSQPPHHALATLASKYGPVMHLKLGEVFAVVISSAEAAEEVLKTNDLTFAQRPHVVAIEMFSGNNYSGLFFAPLGDWWRQIRKIFVYELLTTKRVQSFRLIREEEVWNMIEEISSSEGVAVNLSKMLSSMLNNIICRAAFGQKCKDRAEFITILDGLSRIAGGFKLPDFYPSLRFLRYTTGMRFALKKMHKKIDKILDDVIEENRARKKFSNFKNEADDREDVIDVLLRLQESNELEISLTDHTIKAFILEIFGAGTDSTAATTVWVMSELIKNPRVMAKTQNEIRQSLKGKTKVHEADIQNLDYLKLVVKETLRMHPPGSLLIREARENSEIFGYKIPAKVKVFVNVWAIGRDPKIWIEPNCFNPERFQNSSFDYKGAQFEYLPFGAGRRICPGTPFATANIELAIAQLLYHFNWTLPDHGMKTADLDMTESFGATARKKHDLSLIPSICVPFIR